MSFAFGFADADIEAEDGVDNPSSAAASSSNANLSVLPATEHSLDEFYDTLPDRLSYSVIRIESPTGKVLLLPRRELYDIRVQLMAEDDTSNDEILNDISASDIRSGVYEGGFKTWECSLDLASLLLDRGPRKDIDELVRCDQIVELGAGTAMPSLVLFQHALRNDIAITFTLSDYNSAVLRLATLPNLLLTWAAYSDSPLIDLRSSEGDLEITPDVLQRFKNDLQAKGIVLRLLSGSWSEQLAIMITESAADMGNVILAAETIYSEASTKAFVDLVLTLLRRVKMSKAVVAAKRFYFGVGGSVDGLKEACRDGGAVAYEIENHGVPGMDAGVGRALVEVQMY
ncbi:hypothetical protein AMS68_003799 [Peltaster fructicola]|uniref:protein-histidine N-methyltransferase n=1 Tax=Peltaster fructicola TaxID=286661 RepID=A0A6H0XU44_9PEZI|nr:hypothetical protein AMS68_003799 [Peltaster fructicola]